MEDQAMERAEPTGEEASEPADLAVAIWGDSSPSGTTASSDPPPTDIWGHAAKQAPPAQDDEPSERWPDVWGDQEGWRSRREDLERRHGPLPAGRADRFSLPDWWAAPPKPKSLWRHRPHRR